MHKYANLVELEKCCRTHIFLQNFVLIQPRTSPLKICKNLQNFAKFANFADPNPIKRPSAPLRVRQGQRYAVWLSASAGVAFKTEHAEPWTFRRSVDVYVCILMCILIKLHVCNVLISIRRKIFCENVEIAAVQKYANLVELEKCRRTHIFLQNFVFIQPRTSPPKICKSFAKCLLTPKSLPAPNPTPGGWAPL